MEFSIGQKAPQYVLDPPQTGEVIKNNKIFKSGSGTNVFKVDKR
jgi:hypothetical protein